MPRHSLVAPALRDLVACWRASFTLHLLLQAIALAAFGPLVTEAARTIVAASGEPVISNFDIAAFVLSPAGVFFVAVIAALTFGLLLAEFTGQTWIAAHAIAGRRVSARSATALLVRRFPALVVLAGRVVLRLALFALPVLVIAGLAWAVWLSDHDINYYLAEQPPQWRRALVLGGLLAAAYACVVIVQATRWILAIPIVLLERAAPHAALAESTRRTRGQVARILPPLLAWGAVVVGAGFVLAWLGRQVSDALLDRAGMDFARVLPLIGAFVLVALAGALVQGALLLGGHQFIVTRLYTELRDAASAPPALAAADDERAARTLARPVIVAAAALLLGAPAFAAWRASGLPTDAPVLVTAHRGASLQAPENSMAAFRAAMAAGADYTELDVQRARDGTVIVLHDRDFMRMAGDARRVAELTAAQIARIDIGARRGAEYAGQAAPSLEQVIDLVRGRMKLNVELKYNVPDPALAPAVVEILQRKGFVDQAVISSLDLAGLRQAKALEPRLAVGLIVTASVGNVARTDADFVSLNAAKASAALIRRAHARGKDVHVWTVNQADMALRMIERGADNLITDDPALIARVVRARAALSRGEQLALRLRALFDRPLPELDDPDE